MIGQTSLTAKNRASDTTTAIIDQKLSTDIEILDAPSAAAMIRFLAIVAHTGDTIGSNVTHTVEVADLKGLNKHTTLTDWKKYCDELRKTGIREVKEASYTVVNIIDFASIDYSQQGLLVVSIRMGQTFRDAFNNSNIWAAIDLECAKNMRSKYGLWLYMYLAGKFTREYKQLTLSVDELRHILKIPHGKLPMSANLLKDALHPAIADLCEHTAWIVSFETIRGRRNRLEAIRLEWMKRTPRERIKNTRIMSKSVNSSVLEQDKVEKHEDAHPEQETFPKGFLKSPGNEVWRHRAETHIERIEGGHLPDLEKLANDFREWLAERGISLNQDGIASIFETFCRKYKQH